MGFRLKSHHSGVAILQTTSCHRNQENCTHDIELFWPPTGPGLAIRIICGDEPYQGSDFAETNIILGQIVDFVTAVKKVSYMGEIYLFLGK